MSRLYIFADEAGNFDFRRAPNVSRFFIVCTVTMRSCAIGPTLLDLRRDLCWRGVDLAGAFHCTKDPQTVRDEVFAAICKHDFEVQATIMEKSKAQPSIRPTNDRFYKMGWYRHFQWGMTNSINTSSELIVTAASIGTKKGQVVFTDAVRDVVKQTVPNKVKVKTAFWPCDTDPCLQVADYCTWAIQRKWETGDNRSFDLISDRVKYEFDLFRAERPTTTKG